MVDWNKALLIIKERIEIFFYIGCALFWLNAVFEINSKGVDLRTEPEIRVILLPLGLGVVFLILGLFFSLRSRPKTKRIVLYIPTLKRNPFFHELLDHMIEIISRKTKGRIQIIIRKGVIEDGVFVDNCLDVIKEFVNDRYKDTVIVMIPPSPRSYEKILGLDPDTKINLMTLDIEVDRLQGDFSRCKFMKKVVLLDNKKGCELAAETLVGYCKEHRIGGINTMTCEGDFHERGKYFREYIDRKGRDSGIHVSFIDELKRRPFSKAVSEGYHHTITTISGSREAIKDAPTFIFCANDSMAMGARIALSKFDFGSNEIVKIIGFDASDVTRDYIDLGDRYLCWSVDQKYHEYAEEVVRYAEAILKGEEIRDKVTYITPGVYKK